MPPAPGRNGVVPQGPRATLGYPTGKHGNRLSATFGAVCGPQPVRRPSPPRPAVRLGGPAGGVCDENARHHAARGSSGRRVRRALQPRAPPPLPARAHHSGRPPISSAPEPAPATPTRASASTESTRPDASPSAMTAASTTSASAVNRPEPASSCSSPTATSESSTPPQANCSATSSSTTSPLCRQLGPPSRNRNGPNPIEGSDRPRCLATSHTWSWGESNPRPPGSCRPRYDHSRVLRLCGCRTAGSVDLAREVAPGSFPDVSGLSRRQRSFPPSTTASVAGLR